VLPCSGSFCCPYSTISGGNGTSTRLSGGGLRTRLPGWVHSSRSSPKVSKRMLTVQAIIFYICKCGSHFASGPSRILSGFLGFYHLLPVYHREHVSCRPNLLRQSVAVALLCLKSSTLHLIVTKHTLLYLGRNDHR
jgi:hypothetical protein